MILLKILAYLVGAGVFFALVGWFIGLCIGGQHVQSLFTGIGLGCGAVVGLVVGLKRHFA